MTFEMVLTQRAVKDLDKLEEKVKERIISTLKEYNENPFSHAKKLTNPKLGSYRFKIGDYRVVFDIDTNTIVILRIGHRKSIYK
ncbi:MAG: type II toxin-antitoxin system RelE/ParE family toxin [Candidatus Heimdallarchaeota archaeon]|nr:type II toxin-antitoxin system RelE/ParE family toxin [Candidatus Heimdallarchaeota archaeon]